MINIKQINEMLSNRAVNKSINNGFTQEQHLEATGNIKKLYEDASLTLTRPDEKKTPGSQGLKSIKIFHCDTKVTGEEAVAKLTVKESFQHGHRVYSIELEELNKPTELKNRTGNDSSAGSEGSTQKGNVSSARYAEEPSNESISQEEHDSKPNTASDEEYLQAVDDFKNAKTDEQRRSTFRKLQDMVKRAAEAAGFTNAIPEQTVAYKVRTGAAPKKTIKVYKVFTVANDGSPTALFVGGTEKLPQGVWLDAQDAYHFKAKNDKYYVPSTQNPFTKGGKTGASVEIPDEATRQELIKRDFLPEGSKATKITALAYRPGWHAGTLPFFPQGGMKRAGSNYDNIHRRNQVVFECELAAEKNYTSEAEAQPKARKKDGTLNSREADLQYLPENGFYYYATNPLTHGHPELGMWAISGSLKINRALTQEECDKIFW